MEGKQLDYYVDANTAKGLYSFRESNLPGLDKLYVISGAPGTGKSTLIRKIRDFSASRGYNTEVIHSAAENGSLSGVVIPRLKTGFMDNAADFKPPSEINTIYIDLDSGVNPEAVEKEKVSYWEAQKRLAYRMAYKAFAQALEVHDEWEKIYIDNMDITKSNDTAEGLAYEILGDGYLCKRPVERHRFLGTATHAGPVNFIESLTQDSETRYFIKGRPGTGKSTMLKKIALSARQRGYDIEVYHCGFDPDSLDMLIIRELGLSVFDSTPPHEYFPRRGGDKIIDVYNAAISPGTDEKYAGELKDISGRYKAKIDEGTACLAEAKKANDEMKKAFAEAVNFNYADAAAEKIMEEIANG